jgi:hypothetical protein
MHTGGLVEGHVLAPLVANRNDAPCDELPRLSLWAVALGEPEQAVDRPTNQGQTVESCNQQLPAESRAREVAALRAASCLQGMGEVG